MKLEFGGEEGRGKANEVFVDGEAAGGGGDYEAHNLGAGAWERN